MNLSSYLLKKYLRFDKTQPFITLSAILAFLGVCIGLMVLIIAMAIMNGFDKEFERKLFVMNYPLTILSINGVKEQSLEELKQKFPNMIFSPYISSKVVLKRGSKLEGGIVFGVDFKAEEKINPVFAKALKETTKLQISDFDIIVGNKIADNFLLSGHDKLTLMFSKYQPSGFQALPIMKRFNHIGTFSSGLNAYDESYTYTSLNSLRKILNYDENSFDGIHVYSKNPQDDIHSLKEFLNSKFNVIGWWQQNGNFFSALKLEKRALFIVLMLIILVASLNIVSSLLMTVMNRRQEIALLLSLGATKKEIKKTFFYLGVLIGGGGLVCGAILGFLGIFLLGSFDIISLPADVYGSSKLPLELSLIDLFAIIFGAILIILFSAYYPAYKSSEVDVLKVLRNES